MFLSQLRLTAMLGYGVPCSNNEAIKVCLNQLRLTAMLGF